MKIHIFSIIITIVCLFSIKNNVFADEIKVPTFSSIEIINSSEVKLNFKSNSTCIDCGIEILNVTTGQFYRTNNNSTSYTIRGLSSKKTYKFRISEYYKKDDIYYNSPWTSSKSATPKLMSIKNEFNGKIYKYYQENYKDSYCGGIIMNSGCGPTSMAIAASSLLGKEITPIELTKYGCQIGSYTRRGVGHDFFNKAIKEYGLKGKWVSKSDSNQVLKSLSTGKVIVIAHMGKGHFTNLGHYITIIGVKGNQVLVQDPGSFNNSKYWDFSIIQNEVSKVHKNQFLIVMK